MSLCYTENQNFNALTMNLGRVNYMKTITVQIACKIINTRSSGGYLE